MNLYLVQDADRPMYVIAYDWGQAIARWKIFIADENDCHVNDVDEPDGIQLVCESGDLLVSPSTELSEDWVRLRGKGLV